MGHGVDGGSVGRSADQTASVLHAIDTTGPGGAETVFLNLAQHVAVEGYRTIAVIRGPGWVEEQLKSRQIPYCVVRQEGQSTLRYLLSLYRIMKCNDVRLVQAHLLGSTLTFSVLCFLLGIPLIATLHGRVDVAEDERWLMVKRLIVRLGVKRFITVSRDLADYLVKRGLAQQGLIGVIYNGVDVAKYQGRGLTTIRNLLRIETKSPLIGSLGNIRPAKAYDVLVAAARLVVNEVADAQFVVAGHKKSGLIEALEAQVVRLGLQNNVHFIGYQEDSAGFLSQMDVFALSSSSEGFSLSTVEAMATGLPVVATKCGGPEEIVDHDSDGWLVPSDTPQALAEALLCLLRDAALRSRMAMAGRANAQARFSLATQLRAYRHEYAQLLSRQEAV